MNKDKLIKIGEGALVAGVAAALTYVGAHVADLELGNGAVWVSSLVAVMLDMVRKIADKKND